MKIGDIVRTPYEPSGIVEIVAITPPSNPPMDVFGVTADVRYLHEHYGYPAGRIGTYQLSDLKPLGATEQHDFDRLWRAFKQANDLQLAIAKFLTQYALKEVEHDEINK